MRKIGIVGTRNAPPHAVVACAKRVHILRDEDPETIIVTGGDDEHRVGGNIDRCAERTARSLGMQTIVHLPEVHPEGHPRAGRWVHLGAGVERNTLIVGDSEDGVYAFWNGISTGTRDSIRKALVWRRLREVYFDHGLIWHPESGWDVLKYGVYMIENDMFDAVRIAEALTERLKLNKKSPRNHIDNNPAAPIDPEKLKYANGRAIHAFNSLIEGVRPTQGIGEEEGHWFVPSENKRKPDVRDHHINEKGWCDCDAVTRGFRPCFAMYLVDMYKRIIDPHQMKEKHESNNA